MKKLQNLFKPTMKGAMLISYILFAIGSLILSQFVSSIWIATFFTAFHFIWMLLKSKNGITQQQLKSAIIYLMITFLISFVFNHGFKTMLMTLNDVSNSIPMINQISYNVIQVIHLPIEIINFLVCIIYALIYVVTFYTFLVIFTFPYLIIELSTSLLFKDEEGLKHFLTLTNLLALN